MAINGNEVVAGFTLMTTAISSMYAVYQNGRQKTKIEEIHVNTNGKIQARFDRIDARLGIDSKAENSENGDQVHS